SDSVGPGTGWEPRYVLVRAAPDEPGNDPGRLVGAVACYRKDHSYGEYIFDFGWARSAMRAGLSYYPKLVVAAPVTPATGRRLLIAPDLDPAARASVVSALLDAVRGVADDLGCSSVHWLVCGPQEHGELAEAGYCPRASFQFHWNNPGYTDFDAFLSGLASRKRKQIRKERKRALEAVDGPVEFVPAADWSPQDIADLEGFYRRTCFMHGNDGYLTADFFALLPEAMPQRARFARVQQAGKTVAGALYFQTEHALYGRYWGCGCEIPFLHFEVAYYAGIEHCIREGLPLFEAGAQGEHKLLRGFLPAKTHSNHWMRHPGLREGVERFLRGEARELVGYMEQMARFSPYRKDNEGKPLPPPTTGLAEVGEAGEDAAAKADDAIDVG
ncbi:MAG: GNAT family N-acetyltransferase, partial [Deltaproteobacteria bacterium]|nr:GNAT family N-acetyltransferase [Deltaproteobacteria bacterium]